MTEVLEKTTKALAQPTYRSSRTSSSRALVGQMASAGLGGELLDKLSVDRALQHCRQINLTEGVANIASAKVCEFVRLTQN